MKEGRPPITGIIITLNEERNIRDALESIKWMDEIVVVDSQSSDGTVDICKLFTDRIFIRKWPGFAEQKNFAFSQASHDWLFVLDADERMTDALRQEICETLRDDTAYAGFHVPRLNNLWGRWLKHGGTFPDYQIRLFKKEGAHYTGEVHENLHLDGETGCLKNYFIHYPERDIADHFLRFNQYTTLAAIDKQKRGKSVHWYNLLFNPFFDFMKIYFLKKGFLDGIPGLIHACFSSMYCFVKYAKLWNMYDAKRHGNGQKNSDR